VVLLFESSPVKPFGGLELFRDARYPKKFQIQSERADAKQTVGPKSPLGMFETHDFWIETCHRRFGRLHDERYEIMSGYNTLFIPKTKSSSFETSGARGNITQRM
jgi:hypothetical protein